jgi:hypothetical protein
VKGGPSPNPGGRPKVAGEVKELARRHGPEAVETLVRLMREAERDETRVRAAEALLDRGYGRPTQAITGEDGAPLQLLVEQAGGELLARLHALACEPDPSLGCSSQAPAQLTPDVASVPSLPAASVSITSPVEES